MKRITKQKRKSENKQSLNVLPAYFSISETFHVVLAGSRPASLFWLLVVIAIIGLTVRARGAVLQLRAHVTITVIGLSLKKGNTLSPDSKASNGAA